MNEKLEDISEKETEPISWLLLYMPLQKPTSKVAKDPDSIKFKVFAPLLLEEVPIKGDLLARVPQLCMEYLDLSDREEFP